MDTIKAIKPTAAEMVALRFGRLAAAWRDLASSHPPRPAGKRCQEPNQITGL